MATIPATCPQTLPAKAHSAFDMNAGAHMINCTHLVAAKGGGSEVSGSCRQRWVGISAHSSGLLLHCANIWLASRALSSGDREGEREIEVGEKSQKSTAGITLRTFKYEYKWISKWISHKLIDKVCSNLINLWNLSTEIFQIMKPINDEVSIEYLLVEQ